MTPRQWKDGMRLVRLLRRLHKDQFRMISFGPQSFYQGVQPTNLTEAKECGTACCAAGWGALQNYAQWPKYSDGERRTVGSNSFKEFYGFTTRETDNICYGLMDEDKNAKADQIERILNRRRYKKVRLGATG